MENGPQPHIHPCRTGGPLAITLLLASLTATVWAEENALRTAHEPHMGTIVRIVADCDDPQKFAAAADKAFARIRQIERICSDYRSDSEVLQLSAQSPTPMPITVSDELWQVLSAAQAVWKASDGAFDVTVGPLTKEWRRFRRRQELDAKRIERAQTAVGGEYLVLHRESQGVSLRRPNMRIDLGGIAKGFALDAALEVLRQEGVPRAMVEAGGDMALGDAPRGEPGWRVGIAGLDPRQPPIWMCHLANVAVATSGDAYQFLEIDGERYSHILDPRTGYGVTHRGTVTVFADDAITADAWASAISVLGPQEAPVVAGKPSSVAVWMQFVQGDGSITWASPNLGQWLSSRQK